MINIICLLIWNVKMHAHGCTLIVNYESRNNARFKIEKKASGCCWFSLIMWLCKEKCWTGLNR